MFWPQNEEQQTTDLLRKYEATESKEHPNDVLPRKIKLDVCKEAKDAAIRFKKLREDRETIWKISSTPARNTYYVDVAPANVGEIVERCKEQFKKKSFVEESGDVMANSKLFSNKRTPPGVDPKVYEGVRIGLHAVKQRQLKELKKASKTVCLDVGRVDQRLFTLPDTLEDAQADSATVVLNGTACVAGRDYTISGNIINWVSDRKLYGSDSLAVRYLTPGAEIPYAPTSTFSGLNGLKKDSCASESIVKKLETRIAELEATVEALDTDYDDLHSSLTDISYELEEAKKEDPEPEENVEVLTEADVIGEEEDVIAPGMKVYHRLSGEGPWIVVQPTVLNISSRQEHDEGNVLRQSYVECAWTVQTDDGIMDYPEVVLTTRAPKVKKSFWTWKKVTAAVVGGSTLVAGIVHAPLILQLLGLIH